MDSPTTNPRFYNRGGVCRGDLVRVKYGKYKGLEVKIIDLGLGCNVRLGTNEAIQCNSRNTAWVNSHQVIILKQFDAP